MFYNIIAEVIFVLLDFLNYVDINIFNEVVFQLILKWSALYCLSYAERIFKYHS